MIKISNQLVIEAICYNPFFEEKLFVAYPQTERKNSTTNPQQLEFYSTYDKKLLHYNQGFLLLWIGRFLCSNRDQLDPSESHRTWYLFFFEVNPAQRKIWRLDKRWNTLMIEYEKERKKKKGSMSWDAIDFWVKYSVLELRVRRKGDALNWGIRHIWLHQVFLTSIFFFLHFFFEGQFILFF